MRFGYTVYVLIYRTAKNNYFGNCPGIHVIGTYFLLSMRSARNNHAAACELAKFNRTVCD